MRFLLAFAVLLVAFAAAPALAADSRVNVSDDLVFKPDATAVGRGDTVTWDWTGTVDHTVTSRSRQIDKFDSGIKTGPGKSFKHAFRYPGRFRYLCVIHPDTMKGTVTVGTDDHVAPTLSGVAPGARKIRFKLSERSVVTLKLTGRRKIVKTFGAGSHSLRFKRLAAGRYKASLSAKDGFGHTGRKSRRFRVR